MIAPETIGVLGIAVLLLLLAGGVPIGIGLLLVGLGGLAVMLSPEAALIKGGVVSFEVLSKYELGVLPLFLLMAHICFAAGASRDFFDVAAKFVGHRRGGLALASIGGCAGFGAISGSSRRRSPRSVRSPCRKCARPAIIPASHRARWPRAARWDR